MTYTTTVTFVITTQHRPDPDDLHPSIVAASDVFDTLESEPITQTYDYEVTRNA